MRYTTRSLQLALFLFRSILARKGRIIIIVVITKFGCVGVCVCVCVLRVYFNTCFSHKILLSTVHKRKKRRKTITVKDPFSKLSGIGYNVYTVTRNFERERERQTTSPISLSSGLITKRECFFPPISRGGERQGKFNAFEGRRSPLHASLRDEHD